MVFARFRQCLYLLTATLVLAACGGGDGGGDSGSGNTPPPPPATLPAVQNGVFKDANVSGLAFVSGQESGITDPEGRFTCETGEQVSFSLGNVQLGSTECATLVMPMSLGGNGALDDLEVLNRARFLQMLDLDGDPDNGIEISAAVRTAAATWDPDFTKSDLDTELMTIISEATTADNVPHTLPDENTALDRLREMAECAYAGAFAGPMSGDLQGAFTVFIGFPGSGNAPFAPSSVQWLAFDGGEEFIAGGGGSNSITYSDRPVIDHSGPSLAGPIAGQFVTPDRITGTWESAGNGVSGVYDVGRMGDDSGEFRFIGTFNDSESEGSIVFGLSANGEVTGEAFDIIEGAFFGLDGSVVNDVLDMNVSGGGETIPASGTITRIQGDPESILGTFGDSGSFRASACRLN